MKTEVPVFPDSLVATCRTSRRHTTEDLTVTQVVRFVDSFSGSCEEHCLLRCDAESELNFSVNFIENQVPDLVEISPVVSEMKCATVIMPGMPSLDATKT